MIGGNIIGMIEVGTTKKNDIGETVQIWVKSQALWGWLDLSGGDSRYTTFNAKIEESTHVFICDYTELRDGITAENSRMVIDGKRYDIKLFDNPQGRNRQWEIYLRYTGGQ